MYTFFYCSQYGSYVLFYKEQITGYLIKGRIMTWNVDYGLASFFVLVVLLVYNLIRRELPLRKNFVFNVLLLSILGTDILDIISSFTAGNSRLFSPLIVYITDLLYFACFLTVPLIFSVMVSCLTDMTAKDNRSFRRLAYAEFVIMELLVFSSPLTGSVLRFDPGSGSVRGTGFYVISVMLCVSLFTSCIFTIRHKRESRPLQRSSVYIFAALSLLSVLSFTLFFKAFPQTCFGFALGVLIMYIAVQNPDSYLDHKTGLFSKEGFQDLETELIREGARSSCLSFAFANYEVIKATYGDDIMNPCLRSIADFLLKEVCTDDILSFYIHNGSFVLLKRGSYDFSKEKTAIDIRFMNPWKVSESNFQFSPVYSYISSDITLDSSQAVTSLIYRSLRDSVENGAYSFVTIDEELLYDTEHEARIRKALDNALENDSLEIWFQPIYSPSLDRINSAEALVRVRDEELGIIYPDEFIKTAETNGSIMRLGLQVFTKVCQFISSHDLKKYGIEYIELNLSPIQCLDEHLAEEFSRIRRSFGVDASSINLEITETAASDSSIVVENMMKLSMDGFIFSLDDYGTGYSNLMNMLSLPLSIIKIDKSIVWSYFDQTVTADMAAGGESISIVPTGRDKENNILEDLIPMFQARGLRVLCEGVETREMVRILMEMGCDYMQGFFFSKPIPEEPFIEYVKAKNRNRSTF